MVSMSNRNCSQVWHFQNVLPGQFSMSASNHLVLQAQDSLRPYTINDISYRTVYKLPYSSVRASLAISQSASPVRTPPGTICFSSNTSIQQKIATQCSCKCFSRHLHYGVWTVALFQYVLPSWALSRISPRVRVRVSVNTVYRIAAKSAENIKT